MIIPIVTTLLGTVADYFTDKFSAQKQQREHNSAISLIKNEAEISLEKKKSEVKLRLAEEESSQFYELDKASMSAMETSSKDEYILGLFSVPLIMAFIPGLGDYAKQGFSIINELPWWYTTTFIGIVVTIYGLRSLIKFTSFMK
jgi:hypothetical protein